MKYRIVEVKEWQDIKYKIQHKSWFMWTEDEYRTFYKTIKEAEKEVKRQIEFDNKTETVIKTYN